MGLGLNSRVSIVVGRLIGKVTTNQIANLAGYHESVQQPWIAFLHIDITSSGEKWWCSCVAV